MEFTFRRAIDGRRQQPAGQMERNLLQKVDMCKNLISAHPGADRALYQAKFDELYAEAEALPNQMQQNQEPVPLKKASPRVTATYLLDEARKLLDGTTTDLNTILHHCRRAHKIGKEKGQVAHMVKASMLMGHTRRLLLDPKHHQDITKTSLTHH